jgi:serine/threonine protein phosphatase PrpC
MAALRLRACGLTDVGRQREHNEDSLALVPDQGLFVVADGMGGHQAGDVASNLATQLIADFFESTGGDDSTWPSNFDKSLSDEENRLLTGIHLANRRIFEQSKQNRAYHGMGTTIVGALFSERFRRVYFGHVGDSRAYRIRGNKIEQLTRDHSLQNEPFPNMTEAERQELPRNVITRALGMDGTVNVDLTAADMVIGDVFLLCSDGLSSMVTDEAILGVVSTTPDVKLACAKLVQAANDQGGEDNITAILIRVDQSVESLEEATTQEIGPDTFRKLK